MIDKLTKDYCYKDQKRNNKKTIIKKEKESEFFSFIHPINHAPLSKSGHQHAYKSAWSESMNAQAKSAPT